MIPIFLRARSGNQRGLHKRIGFYPRAVFVNPGEIENAAGQPPDLSCANQAEKGYSHGRGIADIVKVRRCEACPSAFLAESRLDLSDYAATDFPNFHVTMLHE